MEKRQRNTQPWGLVKFFFHTLLRTEDDSVHILLRASWHDLCNGIKWPRLLFAYFFVSLWVHYLSSSLGDTQLLLNQWQSVSVSAVQ